MLIGELLNRLEKVKRLSDGSYMCRCPAHHDRVPSLHISQSQAEDRILLKCQAGCTNEAVVEALQLSMADLFTKEPQPVQAEKKSKTTSKKIVATYDYKSEDGNLLFQVVRYEGKSFAQRHKNSNGDWAWNLENARRVLYCLPQIIEETGKIYFVEGEKDVDNLGKCFLTATTSPGGVGGWRDEYAGYLRGKQVVVVPDGDPPGKAYGQKVARALQGQAASIRCLILPRAKDITDWLEQGGDVAELPNMEQDITALFASPAPEYQRDGDIIRWVTDDYIYEAQNITRERTGIHARLSIAQAGLLGQAGQPLAWTVANIDRSEERVRLANQIKRNDETIRQNLDLFCAGLWDCYISTDLAELMAGEDTGPPTFYLYPYILQGGGTILFAAPGRGKSITALLWAQSINSGISKLWPVEQQPVLYINLERSRQSLKRRLAAVNRVLGLPPDQPLLIFNRRGAPLSALAPNIAKAVQQYNIKLIVLDSISRAGYGDLTENRPINLIIDTLSHLCDTWVALGHTPRADESHIYGGIMFEAGADIVVQLSSEVEASKLGIRYEIVKANDLPGMNAQLFSLQFEGWALQSVTEAKPFEFAELEIKQPPKMLPSVIDFILSQDTGDATATQIAKELGYSRQNVSELLSKSGKFIKTRREKAGQYYGVRDSKVS